MLFNSIEFIVFFLPVTLIGYFCIARYLSEQIAIIWLILASMFFYAWWNPKYVILIIISIVGNYAFGRILCLEEISRRKYILFIGITLNLIVLGYFKYCNFFVVNIENATGLSFGVAPIILPLAISFFTFQQIAYLVDAYRGLVKDTNVLHYTLFVTFFPQLIAGPIVHHSEILPQFSNARTYRININNLNAGATFFFIGLFKKVVMADGLSSYASPVFLAADSGEVVYFFEAWSGAIAYTFQLYFDFSGYSDMAIGIAKMFNVELPRNFNSPYKARNIIDFWRRWHITLSRFLRDYLYIPLGGSYRGRFRRFINLGVTMILGGLWHGASWTFVFWGALHGTYLIVNHGWHFISKNWGIGFREGNIAFIMLSHSLTMLAIIIAWVFFRAESFSGAVTIISGMAGGNGAVLPSQILDLIPFLSSFVSSQGTVALLAGGSIMGIVEMLGLFVISVVLVCSPNVFQLSIKLRAVAIILCAYLVIQSIFYGRNASEFIYFQF